MPNDSRYALPHFALPSFRGQFRDFSPQDGVATVNVTPEESADVIVVGAGVIGLMVAYRLSTQGLRVHVLEQREGPGLGVTSGQAGVIHVVQLPFGSMKSKLARLGNRKYENIRQELGVKLVRMPALLIVESLVRIPLLFFAYLYLYANLRRDFGVSLRRGSGLRKLEPSLSDSVKAGIVVEGYGTIDSNALVNGLEKNLIGRGSHITYETGTLKVEARKPWVLGTDKVKVTGRWVVNAAGLNSDEVARLLGKDFGTLEPGLGVMVVYTGMKLNAIISPLSIEPGSRTKGGAIIPATDGSVVVGPNLRQVESKDDMRYTDDDLEQLRRKFQHLLKSWGTLDRVYTGLRPLSPTGDFIIDIDHAQRLVNLVGIESPGLTAAPEIAEMVANGIRAEMNRL